ncbi:hypothetical protein HPB52_017329 [Rhipicephalus sanguineus]|uniref:Uncharacterized protein n=1 Tax=Rhipicephalus sanguineus TaxID=34632 RepID=A0A9D4PS32_RHISA|nr:hypothetical protein HPB52_017329 [Rhipicephalus sanguineus]
MVSEVGSEPTPTYVDQKSRLTHIAGQGFSLASAALDHSAILKRAWRLQELDQQARAAQHYREQLEEERRRRIEEMRQRDHVGSRWRNARLIWEADHERKEAMAKRNMERESSTQHCKSYEHEFCFWQLQQRLRENRKSVSGRRRNNSGVPRRSSCAWLSNSVVRRKRNFSGPLRSSKSGRLRSKAEREEQERKAREEAERQRKELEERLKREEAERAERKKRVEEIMSRTRRRGGKDHPAGNSPSVLGRSSPQLPQDKSSDDKGTATQQEHKPEAAAREPEDVAKDMGSGEQQGGSLGNVAMPAAGSADCENGRGTIVESVNNVVTEAVTFFVVRKGRQATLGLHACQQFGLVPKAVDSVRCSEPAPEKAFPDLFQGTGCVGKRYRMVLREDAVPVVHPARWVPLALREPLRQELERMETASIIKKVDVPTEWTEDQRMLRRNRQHLLRIPGNGTSQDQDQDTDSPEDMFDRDKSQDCNTPGEQSHRDQQGMVEPTTITQGADHEGDNFSDVTSESLDKT